MRRVVIAGAGVSGLALARALRALGVEPLVIEADERAGGKVRSLAEGGYLCEAGPGAVPAGDPAVAALIDALGLRARLIPAGEAARRRCLALGGRLLAVPRTPAALARWPALPPGARLRVLCDLVLPRGPAARGADESVAAFGRRRLGRTATERVLYPIVSGLYAGDPERVSLPSAFPALARIERESRSVLRGLARAAESSARAPGGGLASFPGGVEELTRTLCAALGDAPRTGAAARRLARRGRGFRLHARERGGALEIDADAVVLAVPAHAAAVVARELAPDAADALAAIRYVPVALVHLGYRAADLARPPDAYGFLVPPAEPAPVLGAVFASAVFPDHAPDGRVLVSVRAGGARDPEAVSLPDPDLVARARAGVEPLIGATAAPELALVIRHERALPQYEVGHRGRVAAIEAAEARLPGLFFAGNAYRGPGLADCVRNAAPLAARIASHLRGEPGAAPPH